MKMIVIVLTAALAAPAWAQTKSTHRPTQKEAASGVRKLYHIPWHASLDGAFKEATKQKRPVLWLRMLGDLAGET